MIFLSIDYGLKRTGVAVCDSSETICTPLEVIEGQGSLLGRLKKLAFEYKADAMVFGLPLNMDDTEGKQAKLVRAFAGKAAKTTSLEVYFQDERLSSRTAERMLIDARLTRKKKKKRLDAVAAAAILDDFLEQNRRQT